MIYFDAPCTLFSFTAILCINLPGFLKTKKGCPFKTASLFLSRNELLQMLDIFTKNLKA
jgi:hypothetical protein